MINLLLPMKNFTQEETLPSEYMLSVIRQIAYAYRKFKMSNGIKSLYLN